VFAAETGAPLNPNTDFHEWKDLIKEAGVRDARLHDARHTAALLLILGVDGRATQMLMGWSDPSMPSRCQHLVKQVQNDIAKRQGDLVWRHPRGARKWANCNWNCN
jgi:integrase